MVLTRALKFQAVRMTLTFTFLSENLVDSYTRGEEYFNQICCFYKIPFWTYGPEWDLQTDGRAATLQIAPPARRGPCDDSILL